MSYVAVPLLHLIFNEFLSYRGFLGIFLAATFGALYLSYYFYAFVKYKPFELQSDEKQMIGEDRKI